MGEYNIEDNNTELSSEEIDENLGIEKMQQNLAQLQADLSAAEAKAAEHLDLLLRTKADQENIRKRARIDVESAHKYGIEKFARSLLNVVDSLERGIESSDIDVIKSYDNETLVKSLKDGMELTLKLLLDTLDQFEVKMLNPVGEIFDPTKHEALSMQEQADAVPNSILVVVQKGFIIHDRVLRPARVIVAKQNN